MGDQLVIIIDNTRGGNSDGRLIQRLTMLYFVNKDDNAPCVGSLKESKKLVENDTEYEGGSVAPQGGVDTHQGTHLNDSDS